MLTLAMEPIGQFRQDKWNFKMVRTAGYHDPIRGGAPSTCCDGPFGWCNSSIAFHPGSVTSSGILFDAHCSFDERGVKSNAEERILVPFKWSGSGVAGPITFVYSWTKIIR